MKDDVKPSLKILTVGIVGLIGAYISRWHGGGFGKAPKFLKNLAWCLPYGVLVFLAARHEFQLPIAVVVALVTAAACFLGKATGHGGGMDLAHNVKEPGAGRELEVVEHLIFWLHGRIKPYWYDALLMAIVGFAAVAGAGVLLLWLDPLAGLVIIAGGLLKAVAYMVGWEIFPEGRGKGVSEDLNEATEIGEALTGLAAFITLGLAYWMVLT